MGTSAEILALLFVDDDELGLLDVSVAVLERVMMQVRENNEYDFVRNQSMDDDI
jgi:hypothetical protein